MLRKLVGVPSTIRAHIGAWPIHPREGADGDGPSQALTKYNDTSLGGTCELCEVFQSRLEIKHNAIQGRCPL